MAIFYLSVVILYVMSLFFLLFLWNKQKAIGPTFDQGYKVSILIPFRNEQENLPHILSSISSLSFAPAEVIFIDDHSHDSSQVVLAEYLQNSEISLPTIKVITSKGIGKKAAITSGLEEAGGDIIFTTDADCDLPTNWIENMLSVFNYPHVQMVAGPVMSKEKAGFFSDFQQIEWASILLVTKAGFELRSPIMCSAANMAYRKSAFLEVEGYRGNELVLSGDDEFLLKKIIRRFGENSAVYNHSQQGLVYTQAQDTWKDLIQQRGRWAGKWRMHREKSHVFSAIVPVFFQLVFLTSWMPVVLGNMSIIFFLILWIAKVISERMVLGKVLSDMKTRKGFSGFFLTSLAHPVFVVLVALFTFFGKLKWKERDTINTYLNSTISE